MFECSFENAVSVAKAGACDLISVFKSVIDEKDNKLLYFMWNLAAVGSTHQFLKFPAITMHHNQRHIFDKIQWMLQNTGTKLILHLSILPIYDQFQSCLIHIKIYPLGHVDA